MNRINVTESFLPPRSEFDEYVDQIWSSRHLTNQGGLLRRLEVEVSEYLGVNFFHFLTNGTLALQLSLRALDITEGEVITTPFSYVATTSAILWERCDPVFVDIEPLSLNIDVTKIEAAITPRTKAILAVHVFGNPCDVEAIESIAKKHGIKVIYDGAHAFGVKHKGKSLLSQGDITTCSFHATKLFQTIEGGAVIVRDSDVSNKIDLIKRFGHEGDNHKVLGINAKASEFQAAMGLCNIKYIDEIIEARKIISETYNQRIGSVVKRQVLASNTTYNYAYYPVIFPSEEELNRVINELAVHDIHPRRYFYPSLNTLRYVESQSCPISEDISQRILCLPLYVGLTTDAIDKIVDIINP